jgi:integrating conjugative element protein (TIGR03749 family)
MKLSMAVFAGGHTVYTAVARTRGEMRPLLDGIAGATLAVLAALIVMGLLVWTTSASAENRPPAAQASRSSKATTKSMAPVAVTVIDETSTEEATLPQRFVWDKVPIAVVLGVGQMRERRITFPAPMFIGLPQEIASFLRVQTVDRTTYLTAIAPFPTTRVVVEDRTRGSVILLDVSGVQGTSSTAPIEITLPAIQSGTHDPAQRHKGAEEDGEVSPAIDYVTLTRFAAKQLYAPRRLITELPGVRRVSLNDAPVIGLYRGALMRATPIAAWRGDSLYVTAVKLQNQSQAPIELDPLEVRGGWRSITFQHGRLLAKGNESDTTVVYLTCDHPFEECH